MHDRVLVCDDDAERLAEKLAAAVRATGSHAINLRVHQMGVAHTAIREQIERLGREMLPHLHARL